MRNDKPICIIICVQVVWIAVFLMAIDCPAATSVPPLSELIEKYAQTLNSVQSMISSYETSSISSAFFPPSNMNYRNEKCYSQGQRRTDGKGRIYNQRYAWGYVVGKGRGIPKEKSCYFLSVNTPNLRYVHSKNSCGPAPDGLLHYLDYQVPGWGNFMDETDAFFLGYLGNNSRMDINLKNAKQVSVRPDPEVINGSVCYVVQDDTKYGDYTLWLDSEHGFQPAKIEASRGGDDIIGVKLPPPEKRVEGKDAFVIDNIKFKMVQGVWVPVEGRLRKHIEWPQHGFFIKYDTHFKTTEIVLNPDHNALGSFADPMKNPKLDPELVNGTLVRLGKERLNCVWRDGKIIDSYGNEIDLTTLKPKSVDPATLEPPSLVGESLPNLGQFSLRPDPKWIKNKMVLVCFWDMVQSPSRNCIQTLNKRARALLDRNVYMVFVHAERVERKKLNAWLKKNRINHPIGFSRYELSGLKNTWGVQSLPWLIMTNRNHIVTSEGFSLDELNEKIKISSDF
jgi:hypothetical protein